MKILYLQHGLGNQMFQYAYVKYLESRGSATIWIDHSAPSLNWHHGFQLREIFPPLSSTTHFVPYIIGRPLHIAGDTMKRVTGISLECNDESRTQLDITKRSKLWIRGYWQESRYAEAVQDRLRNDFGFVDFAEDDHTNRRLAEQIIGSNSVGLHVRRGDYLNAEFCNGFSGICTDQYYLKAIDHIRSNVENPLFFIFSDDIRWVKENLGIENAVVVDHNSGRSSFRDMQLMSLCRHNIIANSSFSWWGAWLNGHLDKIVVAPAKWLNFTTEEFDRGITPQDWIRF